MIFIIQTFRELTRVNFTCEANFSIRILFIIQINIQTEDES